LFEVSLIIAFSLFVRPVCFLRVAATEIDTYLIDSWKVKLKKSHERGRVPGLYLLDLYDRLPVQIPDQIRSIFRQIKKKKNCTHSTRQNSLFVWSKALVDRYRSDSAVSHVWFCAWVFTPHL
jgi:hypothetical protein